VSRSSADAMFNEINKVFKRYGVTRGLGFVPDRLDITTERRANDSIHLLYRERFTYLPEEVLEIALENAVSFLIQLGAPKEKIKRLSDGVEVELEGETELTRFPMLELMIQNRRIGEEVEQTCRDIQSSLRSLMNLFEIAWDFSPEVEKKWHNTLGKLNILIDEHPEMQTEIEEIVKKYSVFPG
jgi:hypothetical protein